MASYQDTSKSNPTINSKTQPFLGKPGQSSQPKIAQVQNEIQETQQLLLKNSM